MRARLNRSAPPPPPPSGKSCGSSGARFPGWGASTNSLALFSPISLRAGTDAVGSSPCFARVGLVSFLLAMAQVSGAVAAPAVGQDPLRSPECGAAREVLERALDDASARRPGVRERLAQARKQAIQACLGGESGEAVRTGAPDPVIGAPTPLLPDSRQAAVRPPPHPATPLTIQRPATITTCDPGGCRDSEGRRLNSMGPLLMGPGGACTVQAGLVHCP